MIVDIHRFLDRCRGALDLALDIRLGGELVALSTPMNSQWLLYARPLARLEHLQCQGAQSLVLLVMAPSQWLARNITRDDRLKRIAPAERVDAAIHQLMAIAQIRSAVSIGHARYASSSAIVMSCG